MGFAIVEDRVLGVDEFASGVAEIEEIRIQLNDEWGQASVPAYKMSAC